MGKQISAYDSMSTLDGTEEFLGEQSGVTETATANQLATWAITTLLATAQPTLASGMQIMGAESDDTAKVFTLDAVSDYAVDYVTDNASVIAPGAVDGAEHVILNDGGTVKKTLVSSVATRILDGTYTPSDAFNDKVLDLTNLDEDASLAGTEYMLLGSGATPKWALLSTVTAYAHDEFDTYLVARDTVTIADADLLYVSDAGTGKKIAASALATYVVSKVSANIVDDIWDNSGAAQAPVDADVFVMEVSGSQYKTTATQVATYVTGELAAAAAVDPVADAYKFFFFDSTTPKTATAAVLATYIGNESGVNASVVTPILTDHVVLNQSGTTKRALVSALATKILDGSTAPSATLQDAVFDSSGLGAATLAGTELMFFDDAGTAKKKTLDQLANWIYTDASVGLPAYFTALNAVTTGNVANADVFMTLQSGAAKKVAASVVYDYTLDKLFDESAETTVADGDKFLMERSGTPQIVTGAMINTYVQKALAAEYDPNWDLIDTDDYTSTPADANTITMQNPSLALMAIGLPLKYTIGGSDYFGIISAVGAGSIDVRGATLVTGDITALYVGPPSRVVTKQIKIPGNYLIPWNFPVDGLTSDLLALIGREYIDWQQADAYLVSVSATQGTADGTNPYINVKIGGNLVLTENGNDGFQMGAAGTWVRSSGVGISLANYKTESDEAIEVFCTAVAGTDGMASDLSIDLTFVLE